MSDTQPRIQTCQSIISQTRRSLKKLPQNREKQIQNRKNLHKAIYVNFHTKKLFIPTQGLFKWNFIFWITEKLGNLFEGNFSGIVARYYKIFPQLSTSFKFKARSFTVVSKTANLWNHLNPPKTICKHPKPSTTIQNHPPKNIYNHPRSTITTQSHPQSTRIYLELAVTRLKTSISMWEHQQSFTKHLRPTLVFMWNSALRQRFNFCISEDFC